MLLVCAVVFNVIDVAASDADYRVVPVHLAVGFLLVGLALAASGLLLSRTLAWSLAGLSGWAASIVLQMDAPNGEWLSLVVATLVSAALLTAFVLTRRYLYAVIGCVILLISGWPLYWILDDAVGAAIGLVAAGAVLISSVVVLSAEAYLHFMSAARFADARSCVLQLLAHRAWEPLPSSSLAEERTPPLTPPPCGGARFPDARSSTA